jgi:hypothetical protein
MTTMTRFLTRPEIEKLPANLVAIESADPSAVALIRAFNAVPESDKQTREVLRAIICQKGCDASDGRLTTFMDLTIFG